VLEAYLADFSVLHSDSLLCSSWAAVRNESTRKGCRISSADAWIAATVLVLSAPLVTNNPKEYRHFDKLQILPSPDDSRPAFTNFQITPGSRANRKLSTRSA
jgi:predicted nucleic acid-binding protein